MLPQSSINTLDLLATEILKFVSFRYPIFTGIFFYGSHALGTPNSASDVDIIVVFEKPISPFREKISHDGLLFDVFLYDQESLHGALHIGRSENNFIVIDSISSAKILIDKKSALANLQESARFLRQKGPTQINIQSERQFLTGVIDDLCADQADDEYRTAQLVELYTAVMGIQMKIRGMGGYSRRDAAKALSKGNENLARSLNMAFKQAILGKDVDFIKLAQAILNDLGGPLRDGYRASIPDMPRIPLFDRSICPTTP
jgi:predicted nucleotidyltransferase